MISGGTFDRHSVKKQIEDLTKLEMKPDFWSDKAQAQKIIKTKKRLTNLMESFDFVANELLHLEELKNLIKTDDNNSLMRECTERIDELFKLAKKNQVICFLSGKDDVLDVYIEIHAGAGGTESQDWADMLRKMYLKWLEKKNLDTI